MNNPVLLAMQSQNLPVLKSLISSDKINEEDRNRLQEIFYDVASTGSTSQECLEFLLNFVDVNRLNRHQRSALHLASYFGHEKIVQVLLEQLNIDINLQSSAGCTALYFAACKGYTDIVMLLIEAGADVRKANNLGSTPLIVASYNGHRSIVELLLKNAADPNQKNQHDITPMHAAAANSHTEIIKLLEEHGGCPTLRDQHNRSSQDILQSKLILGVTPNKINQLTHNLSTRTYDSTEDTTIEGSPHVSKGVNKDPSSNLPSQPAIGVDGHRSAFKMKNTSWLCGHIKPLVCLPTNASAVPNKR